MRGVVIFCGMMWALCLLGLAVAAHGATLPATPATLSTVFTKAAAAGDTLTLAPGAYGKVDLARRFASAVTLTCADPTKPPSFAALSVTSSSYVTVSCARVDFVPDAKTATYSWATRIQDSDHVTFKDVRILGGVAVSGLNEDGTGTEYGGNIIGRPTAYGILFTRASNVLIDGGEVASFYKGIMLQWTRSVTIRGVDLHDMRTTAIVGADNSDLTVDGNWLHAAHPWRWGNGDHADLLALWSNANQTTPNARVRIVNNRMEQLSGEAILGMWLQGGLAAPFTDFEISGNRIVVNNLQGIFFHDVKGGKVSSNQLYRASGGDPSQSPTVLVRENSTGVTISGNRLGAPISDTSGGANPANDNTVVLGDANIWGGAPTPAPTPDPQIAALQAQVADLTIQLSVARATITSDLAQISSLTSQLNAANVSLAAARAQITAARAALAP